MNLLIFYKLLDVINNIPFHFHIVLRIYSTSISPVNNHKGYSRFAEFLPLIYPPELEVKETTDTASSASFLDLYLEFDDSGQISTKIYDKRDNFLRDRICRIFL
jgi:hypothetical protein